jgi:hypothetical protein
VWSIVNTDYVEELRKYFGALPKGKDENPTQVS